MIRLVTLLVFFCTLLQAREGKPNIVVILADDLGYGDVGCYGSKVNQTPHIDKLAAGGIRFTDFHSNGPMCSPTRTAFLTGQYQNRFGRRFEAALSGQRGDAGLPMEAVTIAELLRDAGYTTGCFGKWHLGYEAPWLPVNQGFDEFRGLLSGDGDFHTRVDRSGNPDWWHGDKQVVEEGYTTDLITKHSIDFIENHRQDPFFLYIPHLAIHFPWQGPKDPPHRETGQSYHNDKWGIIPDRSNVQPHVTAMVESLDASVGEIIAALEKHSLSDNTLVIFSSDNGGYINYGGGFENISSNGPFRGQKTDIYEGGHRVPTIAWWPGKIAPSVSDDTTMTFDLFPTFAKLAGVDAEECDGVDIGPLLFSGKPPAPRTFFWRMREKKAVRDGDYKLCQFPNRHELYDLSADPGEAKNIAKDNADQVTKMQKALAEWETSVDRSAAAYATEPSE